MRSTASGRRQQHAAQIQSISQLNAAAVQRPQDTALKLPFRRPLLAGSGHQQHLHRHPKSRDALDAPQDRIPQQPIAPDGVETQILNLERQGSVDDLQIRLSM